MSRYQKIYSQIWYDEFKNEDSRTLFLYCLSSPHSNILGAYILKKGYICEDLKWQSKKLKQPLDELLQKGYIYYDEIPNLIVIPKHFKHNGLDNPNQITSAIKVLNALPRSNLYSLVADFLETTEKKQLYERLIKRLRERLSQPIRNTETETETETETDERLSQPIRNTETEKQSKKVLLFDRFWQAYPKKKSKGLAEKAFKKINPSEQLLATMLAKIEQAKTSENWTKEGGKYIPYPASWLNAKGWEDEETEMIFKHEPSSPSVLDKIKKAQQEANG